MLRLFRRWRFETPEMEAEFQAQMDTTIRRTFNVCCIFMFLFSALMLILRYTLLSRTTVFLALPYILVIALALAMVLVCRCVPATQPYIPTLLPLASTTVIGLTAWSVHGLVSQTVHNILDLGLPHAMALVRGHAAAEAELVAFIRWQVSVKAWYLAMLIMFITVDSLRLTGTTHSAFYVHLMPIVAMLVTTYCSDEIAVRSVDSIGMGVIVGAYTLTSSIHTLMTFRDRFRADYRLRQRLAQEAEGMEVAKNVEMAQRQASQKADSMLNHILKNIMADAHGCVDLYLGNRDDYGADGHLRRAQESLERGMRWCKKRQVMVQVNSGDYTPILAPTSLRQLIDGMVYGRDILVDIPELTVLLDSLLCEVVLDNAISNAVRHGDITLGPISLVVTTNSHKEHSLQLTFTLSNFVSGGRLQPELVDQLAAGHNVSGLPGVSTLSDHLGLRHMFMAAAAHGMEASLEQVGNLVIFTASLEVDLEDDDRSNSRGSLILPPPTIAPFPPGLWIICLDDSEIARRVLLHGLAAHAPQTLSQAYGATEEEVAAFETAALGGADIAILDQHLDFRHGTLYGTDIARRLRSAGYAGLVCVRSANATEEDRAVYLQHGADCMLGKDLPLRGLVEALQLAYEQHARACRARRSTSHTESSDGTPSSPTASLSFGSDGEG
eukprot:EG_transcript_4960